MNPIEHRARPATLARAPANKRAAGSRVTHSAVPPRSAPSPGTRPTAMVSSAPCVRPPRRSAPRAQARAPRAPATCASALSATSSWAVLCVPASAPRSFAGALRAFAASADLAGAPMYTRTHEILRPRVWTEAPEPSTSGASDEFVFVRVGLADRAFDEIGDVKAIAAVAAAGSRLRRDENVCVLSWEGFKRTASDELYHAVWANASGDRRFAATARGEVAEINASALGPTRRASR